MTATLQFSYDPQLDVIEIEGIKYSGGLFRAWSADGIAVGTLFRLLARGEADQPVIEIEINPASDAALHVDCGYSSGSEA